MNAQKYQPPKPVSAEHQCFLKKVGDKLQSIRKKENINMKRLSTELGISRNSYSLMEQGRIYFSTHNLLKILDYYKIPASDFFRDL